MGRWEAALVKKKYASIKVQLVIKKKRKRNKSKQISYSNSCDPYTKLTLDRHRPLHSGPVPALNSLDGYRHFWDFGQPFTAHNSQNINVYLLKLPDSESASHFE